MARPKAGSNFTIAQLESILGSRRTELASLSKQQTKLHRELAEVEKKIAALGGKVNGRGMSMGGGIRPKNSMSLVESLEKVLGSSTSPMKVGDIVDSVLKSGYRTSSDNFRGIVNQTLIKERRRFASAGRGLYAMKGKK